MNILGIVAHTLGYGDSSAALAVNGKIIGVVEEERFSRQRYDDRFPKESIKFLLDTGRITGAEIDLISLHLSRFRGIGNRLYWAARNAPQIVSNIGVYLNYYNRYGNLGTEISKVLGCSSFKVKCYGHHKCHAAAAFYSSSFDQAAFLTIDGSGEGMTGSYGIASKAHGIKFLGSFPYPHSLGLAYSAICDQLGFPPPEGPGKIMGLSAYGDSNKFINLFRKAIKFNSGKLKLDLDYFLFHKNLATPLSSKPWVSNKFIHETEIKKRNSLEPLTQAHKDLAAALQARTNEVGLELARYVAKKTQTQNLCLAGGVILNSVMNGIIQEAGIFKNIYAHSSPGDAGNALGSVFLASTEHGIKIPEISGNPFTGPAYNNNEIESRLNAFNINYRRISNISLKAAEAIRDGKIIGWFQGKMEFGPRALGARSILADPQNKEMRNILNSKVKHREWFRPFAPSVTLEACNRYFTGPKDNPFMLFVANVKNPWKEVFPSITHVDGTARVQTVRQEDNPKFYQLLKHLEQIHNHPVVLNTSFNLQEPIVCSPDDAIKCFLKTEIDHLFIGDFVIDKN